MTQPAEDPPAYFAGCAIIIGLAVGWPIFKRWSSCQSDVMVIPQVRRRIETRRGNVVPAPPATPTAGPTTIATVPTSEHRIGNRREGQRFIADCKCGWREVNGTPQGMLAASHQHQAPVRAKTTDIAVGVGTAAVEPVDPIVACLNGILRAEDSCNHAARDRYLEKLRVTLDERHERTGETADAEALVAYYRRRRQTQSLGA